MKKTKLEKAFEFSTKNALDLLEPNTRNKIANQFGLSNVEIPELECRFISNAEIVPQKVEIPLNPTKKTSNNKVICYCLPNGNLHNENEPALTIFKNNKPVRKEFYVNGKLHKKGKPAVVWNTGKFEDEFYVNGRPQDLEAIKSLLENMEQEFMAMEDPLDSGKRDDYWFAMAEYNSILGEVREASICWANASWEGRNGGKTANKIYSSLDFSHLDEILKKEEPETEEVYLVVYWVISAFFSNRENEIEDLFAVQNWVGDRQNRIDVRSIWLFRYAVSQMLGNDALMLASTRDALFERIKSGLSASIDLPRFVRFAGQNSLRVSKVSNEIDRLNETYANTNREKKQTEANEKLTNAYVNLTFAYAFARLGSPDKSNEFKDKAKESLNLNDKIHGYLFNAYVERIEQANNGEPAETPLSRPLSSRLEKLSSFERYKIDRLREVSDILEPQFKVKPILMYQQGGELPEIKKIREIKDKDKMANAIVKQINDASKLDEDKKIRLLSSIIEFLYLSPAKAKSLIIKIEDLLNGLPNEAIIEISQKIIFVAGYFGHKEIISRRTDEIKKLLKKCQIEFVINFSTELGKMLRLARRMGFENEILEILKTVASILDKNKESENAETLIARVYVAGSLAYLGEPDKQKPVLKQINNKISKNLQDESSRHFKSKLISALSYAYSQFDDDEYAIKNINGLKVHLKNITDGYGTNTHFCKSVVCFIESLVMGFISDSLVFGHARQKWADEDEYLVRRRINKDLSI